MQVEFLTHAHKIPVKIMLFLLLDILLIMSLLKIHGVYHGEILDISESLQQQMIVAVLQILPFTQPYD